LAFVIVVLLWLCLWCGDGCLRALFKATTLATVEYFSGSLDNLALPLAAISLDVALGC
jgi:hypothetical protein